MKKIALGWRLVENEARSERREYSFFQVFEKKRGSGHEVVDVPRHVNQKTVLVIRYGGFGDMMQMSAVLPHLKKMGYHVTVNTTPRGHSVLREDPHIDAFFLQEQNQIPNLWLDEYWQNLGNEFDRVINLSESVEGTLLALPGRRTHALPKLARHMHMNINYVDFTLAIAEVIGAHLVKFYATAHETAKARKLCKKLGPGPTILWSLSGSSVHKVWPHTHIVVDWILRHTDAKVIFCGGPKDVLLEEVILQHLMKDWCDVPFEDSDKMSVQTMAAAINAKQPDKASRRLHFTSGEMGIRDTLALAQVVDLVVGPETGVLNAVSMEPVPKICMLSHSSVENLTRDWFNCDSVEPLHVPCYPCHRMHYERKYCPIDEPTGAAVCAASIGPKKIFESIKVMLQRKKVA